MCLAVLSENYSSLRTTSAYVDGGSIDILLLSRTFEGRADYKDYFKETQFLKNDRVTQVMAVTVNL